MQAFVSSEFEHTCQVPSAESLSYNAAQMKALAIPLTEKGKYDSCRYYAMDYEQLRGLTFDEAVRRRDEANASTPNGLAEASCEQWNYDEESSQYASSIQVDVSFLRQLF